MAKNAPWYPEYDQESALFFNRLVNEKYNGDIDDTGRVRWSSEWRMHRSNGMNEDQAWQAVSSTIDAIRAGQPQPQFPPGEYDAQWMPFMDADSTLFVHDLILIYMQHPAGPALVDNTGWVRWSSDYRNHRDSGFSHEGAMKRIQSDIFKIWGIQPIITTCRRPIVGRLRTENKLYRDDTGYRRVFGDSEFVLLRMLKYNPPQYEQSMNDCMTAGFQTRRVFASVGGWVQGWTGYEVVPVSFQKWEFSRATGFLRPASLGPVVQAWPDYDDLFRTMLRDHRDRGIRIDLTFGDCQIITPDPNVEIALHERLARIAAEEGGNQVISNWQIRNEYPQNGYGGASPEAVEQMGRVIAAVHRILPDVLCSEGAAISEEPDQLLLSAKYGDVCAVHTTREPFATCMKRTFGLVYWEGQYRAFPKAYLQSEPKGPNVGPMDGAGDDMYQPTNDPAEIVALYAMHALTGQASTYFDGASVRGTARNADAWGYDELPLLFEKYLPEDVATWDHGSNRHGGIEYWWKGNEFVTSTYKDWDTSPPRPVATWTLIEGDTARSGTGTPPRATGMIVGTFAG